ncbi:MAG: serine/threonine protein kinase, partial [Gammaproteobacteria bacterium]|nr:serine/threonine protein kinase [Gammaproteobacteria bacterium]
MVSGGTNSTNGQSHRIALPAGYVLHWYQIESVLGQGGFGITYLAHDTNLKNQVAIKEFLPTDLATRILDSSVMPISDGQKDTYSWGLNRFITEAQILAKFRHPNIVQVLAVFEANNTAYMVMEYVKGRTLEDALKFKKIEGETEFKRIIFAILDGLERIHNAGFIHRDIKPDNIYLREDGTPVLLDFGSARQAIGAQTRTLTALVSPGYAPLEQYDNSTDGERKQGPWTDIYALGATLYRAIVGKGPPDAMQRVNAMVGGKDPYISVTELGEGRFSEPFLRAIDYALAFHQEERPQSIAEWRFALEGKLSPDAQTAVFATPGTKPSAFQRTAPAGPEISADATRPKTDSGPTAAGAGQESGTQPQGPEHESALVKRKGNAWGPIAAVVVIAIVVGAVFWIGKASRDNQAESANSAAVISPEIEEPLDPEMEARRRAEEARRQAEVLEKQLEAQQQLAKAEAKRVAELEAERERKERITALLDGARSDLAEGRLTRPKENNAFYRLSKVIALDSENADAKEALKGVVEGLVARSSEAIVKEEFSDASAHLAEAEAVLPGSQIVVEARVALEQAKVAYEEEQR